MAKARAERTTPEKGEKDQMFLVPFFQVEPDLAVRETRTATLFKPRDGIPAGSYGLIEFYCPDPKCDCRRVMIRVVEEKSLGHFLASIGYGFDRDDAEAGPYLDPLNEQCHYAAALLRLVVDVGLRDSEYVSRLERHYALVKRAAADPEHPAYETLHKATDWEDGGPLVRALKGSTGGLEHRVGPAPRRSGRNDPCPCGSGKKWRYCCGRRDRS